MSTQPLPTIAMQDALAAIIDARIEQALQRRGVVGAPPGPRELRIQRGLSISELASKAGLTPRTVSLVEQRKIRHPKPDTLGRIARALQIPEAEFRAAFARGGAA